MKLHTIGHGRRPLAELVTALTGAGARTLVDVRRYPGSRRNPQFNQGSLDAGLAAAGLGYRHEEELGGRLHDEPGEERFPCIRVAAFRSYTARMASPAWQAALERALTEPAPCFMCAETFWARCHRRLIAELLTARGHEVVHVLGPGEAEPHLLFEESEVRAGRLYLCGSLVA